MLGLKSLPVNHPLHRVYRITAGIVGAILAVFGLLGLLSMGDPGSNFLDVSMADMTVLFVAGMLLLAAGFYGRVGESTAH